MTRTLRHAPILSGWWTSDQRRESPQVLSGRWQQEQTRPGRLVVHADEADRASGHASSVRTASRSSCAHVVTPQSLRCQQQSGNPARVAINVACCVMSKVATREGPSSRFDLSNIGIYRDFVQKLTALKGHVVAGPDCRGAAGTRVAHCFERLSRPTTPVGKK